MDVAFHIRVAAWSAEQHRVLIAMRLGKATTVTVVAKLTSLSVNPSMPLKSRTRTTCRACEDSSLIDHTMELSSATGTELWKTQHNSSPD